MNDIKHSLPGNETLPEPASLTQGQWHSFGATLLAEIEKLRAEVAELRDQRRALCQLIPVPESVREFCELSKEQATALIDDQGSLDVLIAELEHIEGA